jgi:type IV secretion system protein VirB11
MTVALATNNKPAPTGAGFMSRDKSLTVRQLMLKYGLTETLKGNITELAINRPLEFFTESSKGWEVFEDDRLTLANLEGLANAIAVFNDKQLTFENPIVSLTLPDGERCQIVIPPACENDTISLTIRKPSSSRFSLEDYSASGRLNPATASTSHDIADWEKELLELVKAGNFEEFFKLGVAHRLNFVTVGGTGSGKTTFSKCLIDLFPKNARLFTVEDSHELTTPLHRNSVHLFFSPTLLAKAVLQSCMRMKPDHIFITELRGDETWDYLMALKSGHSGSVTSIHANDCRGALYKIGSYIKQSEVGQTLDFQYIMQEVMTTIDVVVFFDKTKMTEIYYDPVEKLRLLRGAK